MWHFGKHQDHVTTYKEIHFDQRISRLKPYAGEDIVLELNDVEDTKAGKYERGKLLVTTLRVIWMSSVTPYAINLSVGLQTVQRLDTVSRSRADIPSLQLLTAYKTNKFEFIFTPSTKAESQVLLQCIQLLLDQFNASSRFREVRMRANLTTSKRETDSKELILLQGEQIHEQLPGVMNLSKDHGQLGTFWVTDIRVAWAAQLQDNYNCSMPYPQILAVRQQKTRFGNVLVVETFPQPQKFLLGFQIKPLERLDHILQHINVMLSMSRNKPNFGLQPELIVEPMNISEDTKALFDRELDLQDDSSTPSDGLAAYQAAAIAASGEPVFDPTLGLTVEAMPPEITLKTLWSVL